MYERILEFAGPMRMRSGFSSGDFSFSRRILGGLIAADTNFFETLQRRFGGEGARLGGKDVLWFLLLAGVVVLIAWVLVKIHQRQEKHPRLNHPGELFRGLCRAHGLDRESYRFLKRLAKAQGLSDPGRLFVEPERFAPAELGPEFREMRGAIEGLRDRIFGLPPSGNVKLNAAPNPVLKVGGESIPLGMLRLSMLLTNVKDRISGQETRERIDDFPSQEKTPLE